jgi:predicted ATP-dependent serine protease
MIGLTGYRGVGKTTLLLQKLADMDVSNSESLYISADNPLVLKTVFTILEIHFLNTEGNSL